MTEEKRQPFAWYDNTVTGTDEKPRVHPLALTARALSLSDALLQIAVENNPNDDRWIVYGLSSVSCALAKSGDLDSLGLLLTGLESLVDAHSRTSWPLHEECAPLRKPVPLSEAASQAS